MTIHGMVYNPTWTTWTPGGAGQLSDEDFFNDSFQGLWDNGSDGTNTYRNDLGTIVSGGFNLVRLFNWGPTRGWNGSSGTAHLKFLDYALSLGLKVIVPISNYFLSDDTYAWATQDPDSKYSFTSAPSAIQDALTHFLSSVTVVDPATKVGKIHPAVHSFAIGNEIDLNTFVGQGSSGAVGPSSRLARVIWWIVNLQGTISSQKLGKVMLTSPISNGDQGGPGTTPPSYWFQAFVNGVTAGTTPLPQGTAVPPSDMTTTFGSTWAGLCTLSWYTDWYYNSVNIYQTGTGLTATLGQYDSWATKLANNANWPGQQFTVPLLLTEIGSARPNNGTDGQNTQYAAVTLIAQTIESYLTNNSSTHLMGYCIYEFSDEIFLGAEQQFGLFMVEPTVTSEPNFPNGNVLYWEATGPTTVSWTTWPSVKYQVDQLFPVTSGNSTLVSALKAIFSP